ncbi:adipolin isoform X1 [Ovis aries]|uniref:C1q and TNF related 12 n=1 Tax=Ovis aries TaxID=9940 RepID=A0AC11BIN2_SHEEP|nr:adipolin isoform X1 [Ovis aries]
MRWAWVAATVLLWPQLAFLGGSGARREPKRPRQSSQRPIAPSATTLGSEGLLGFPKLPEASGPEFTDAHVTWLNFVRRPDHGPSKKRCRGQDKKLRGLSGPPGHPGVEVPQESALREFQDMLKEATEHRSLGLLGPVLPEGIGRQLVAEAFHCRLRGPVLVDKKTLVELQGFQAVSGHGGGPHRTAGHSGPGATLGLHTAPRLGPAAQGAFLRGSGLSLASGRFTAPVTAIFQFSASLHVDPRELQGRVRPRARDTVRVLVCIESLCHRYMSLEAISSLESSGSVFSMHVQGLLQLQAGQYTSVFVDNGSGAALTVQSSSSFSGLLLGP